MSGTLVEDGSGYAALQTSEDGELVTVSGVALGVNDVTRGQSGLLKKWPAEALREAAETLKDKPLVVDHINHRVEDVKGRVTKAGFKAGVGVIFEGEIESGDLAEKIGNGWLDVSPRILHEPVEEMEVEGQGDDPIHVVGKIEEFVNLSLVTRGAAPSNSITVGEHEDLSSEAVMRFVRQAVSDSLGDRSPGSLPVDVSVDVSVPTESLSKEYAKLLSGIKFSEENDVTDSEDLAKHEVHRPDFSGTTEGDWSKPSLEDFTDESWDDLDSDEKSDVGDHFIVSKTGFPADNFGDLSLPVVNPSGDLNLNALQNAKARVGQVSGLSDEDQERAESIINSLANDNFDTDFEENASFEVEEAGLHTFKMSLFDRPLPEDEADSIANSLSGIDGVEAIVKSGEDTPQIVVVVDPDGIDGNLNDDIKNALDDTPFILREEFDWVERVVREESRLSGKDSSLIDMEVLGDDDSRSGTSTGNFADIEILL